MRPTAARCKHQGVADHAVKAITINAYFQALMSFATGPWHTPPNLPDDPAEWCLVLLFRKGAHYRYDVLRYKDGWVQQNGEALGPETWVSRWAYVASSIERMSELPPLAQPPTESRLFVGDALTDAERMRLLVSYVGALKRDLAQAKEELDRAHERNPSSRHLESKLRCLENERKLQLASREKRLDEQRVQLISLREQVQKLTSALAKQQQAERLKERLAEAEQRAAAYRSESVRLKSALEQAQAKEKAQRVEAVKEKALRDKKIHEQRRTLVDLEALVLKLKERLNRGTPADR